MRLVLAAKPLPRLLYFVSSILQMNVAAGLIYVFVIMRKITTSNERYELVPSYFVAVLLLICAVFSLFSTKGSFQKEKHQINCGIALFTSSIVICIISATCTIWLATINDNFTMCTYDEGRRACQCKLNMTGIGIADQWYVFEDITGCHKVDHLSRCMTASALLVVVGLFLCVVNLANYALTLKALRGGGLGAADSFYRQRGDATAGGDFAHWVRRTRPALAAAALFLDFAPPPPPPRYGEAVQRPPDAHRRPESTSGSSSSASSSLTAPASVDGAPPPYSKKDLCQTTPCPETLAKC